MKMNEQELQAIKERMNSADSGFWIAEHSEWPGNSNLQYWVNSTELDGDGLCACVDIKDAEFIAHARQDVPKLVAEVERLRKALEYYADEKHYEPYNFNCYGCDVTEDDGMIARLALEGDNNDTT